MHKIVDVAKMFCVSKVTIYKKLQTYKTELDGHVKKIKNVTYLDDKAIEIIESTLEKPNNKEKEVEVIYKTDDNEYINRLKKDKYTLVKSEIENLENILSYLLKQKNIKENQIKEKEIIIKNYKELLQIKKRLTNTSNIKSV